MRVVSVDVTDRYFAKKYALERRLVRIFTNSLQQFLVKRPNLEHSSRRNYARILTYVPSGMRAWREYMPSGFATHHVHSPESKHMSNGHSLDAITTRFFRHSYDAIGLRSRAHIMSWQADQVMSTKGGRIVWLSLAAGSGQPVYDALSEQSHSDQKRVLLNLVDIDQGMLDFAQKIYQTEKLILADANFVQADVLEIDDMKQLSGGDTPTIIDAMGLFEYLRDTECTKLLRAAFDALSQDGVFIFTNMSPEHPHLDVHKRALGWPGVIQRDISDVARIVELSGVPLANCVAYQPQDKVYNVYRITK